MNKCMPCQDKYKKITKIIVLVRLFSKLTKINSPLFPDYQLSRKKKMFGAFGSIPSYMGTQNG